MNENMEMNKTAGAQSDDTVYVDEMLQDLVPGFMQNRRNEFAEFEKMYAAKDFESLARMGHKLIGTGYNYGFQKLGDLASDLEKAGKEKNDAGVRKAIDGICNHVKNAKIIFITPSN